MDKDAIDRGLERLLAEERVKEESEMWAGMAKARLAAGDGGVTVGEMWGWHYSLIRAIKEVMDKAGLSLDKAKSFVEAYAWDRTRTIEAACEYARGELPQPLDLKSKMSTKEWLEIREAIEAEPDLEIYRCEKVQLNMYLRSRSKRYENLCKRGEARIRRRH